MRAWAFLMGGLLIWTVHFFAVYLAASIFLTSGTTRIITAFVTLACLAAAGALTWVGCRELRRRDDRFERWTSRIAVWAGIGAFVAVLWQGLPALLI